VLSQPSFGRRGGARPRFFAQAFHLYQFVMITILIEISRQADGDNDTGSLGALLNDVNKAVNLNTGFRFVQFSFVLLSL
jgi:hypothetical protein